MSLADTHVSRRGAALSWVGVVLMAAILLPCAWADEPRYLGAEIDNQNKLTIKQTAGDLVVSIVSRARPGEDAVPRVPAELNRLTAQKDLAHIRSEILKPAAPNYLKNPGQSYRITVESLALTPPYVSVANVNAADARGYLTGEICKVRDLSQGVEKEALNYASLLVVSALTEVGLFPANIPLSQQRSKVGQARISGPELERKSQPETGGFNVYQNKDNYDARRPDRSGSGMVEDTDRR